MSATLLLSLSPRASYHWVHSYRNITEDAHRQQLVVHAVGLFGLRKTAAPFSLCVSPKVGCSELLEYARWLSLDQEEFCKYTSWHIVDRDGCTGPGERPPYSPTHLKAFDVWQIKKKDGIPDDEALPACLRNTTAAAQATCPNTPTLVVVRGPWERLVSGYVDKFMGASSSNEESFTQRYMPKFSANASLHPFERFLQGLVDTKDRGLDPHFQPQTYHCLREPRKWTLAADLSVPSSLDAMSKVMGAQPSQTFSKVMPGAYGAESDSGVASQWCWEGCGEPHATSLIRRVQERFADDITAIKRLGGKDYTATFDAAVAACASHGRLCYHAPHDSATALARRAANLAAAEATRSKNAMSLNQDEHERSFTAWERRSRRKYARKMRKRAALASTKGLHPEDEAAPGEQDKEWHEDEADPGAYPEEPED
tara:strand:+ start:3252 stop:4529 length:1278 start_codon:yes stop_codon:yes gene_type:complete